MKALIVFHSVCGNNFQIAKYFQTALTDSGFDAQIRSIADADRAVWQERFSCAAEFAKTINSIPEARVDELPDYDLIILGSPNYFGNVSAEMKRFMDDTAKFYVQQPLQNKYAAFFCSSSSNGGGGVYCLEAMCRFAQHTGMIPLPLPLKIQQLSSETSAYGFTHISGLQGARRPDENLRSAIVAFVKNLQLIVR
ncbi:MAG: NAD(P)H-dependent oxidoreductase [Lentisphaeria bacterium]|nr:NAD(P)H-dependent oxidoreductase [Lentisphaeria bacterium]